MATAAAGARREADSSRRTPPPRGEEREREEGERYVAARGGEAGFCTWGRKKRSEGGGKGWRVEDEVTAGGVARGFRSNPTVDPHVRGFCFFFFFFGEVANQLGKKIGEGD